MTQTIVNLGTGGAVLNGQNGSTAGADSNDALFLDWDGLDYVYLPGVASNFLSVPDEAALDITGDLDIRLQIAMDDWTPSGFVAIWGKFTSAQKSYILLINPTGALRFVWSVDGSSEIAKDSTVATGIADGTAKWVRVTLDVNNGASGNDVKFFLSDDAITWTQLGSTVTTAGVTSIFAGTSTSGPGGASGVGGVELAGKFYRAQVFNGIDGTKVLDVDTSVLTTGAATSFTALTSQTVTISRSTAGRKTVAVVSPVWLFGTDDYMEVADNALLDFGASDSFTVLAVIRQWHTGSFAHIFSKIQGLASVNPGYALYSNSTDVGTFIADGTNSVARTAIYSTSTLSIIGGVRSVTSDNVITYVNGVASTATTDGTTLTLTNGLPMRVSRSAGTGAGYVNMELVAVAVFRRALSAAEISAITSYYQARLS